MTVKTLFCGSDLFSYLNDFSEKLYCEKEFVHSQYSVSNRWDRICSVYSDIYDHRLNRTEDTEVLEDKIEETIKLLNKDKILRITPYEKEFLTASLYGSLAYIRSDDPSFGMLRNVNKADGRFSRIEKTYKTADSGFGSALKNIAMGMYFENSFWVGRPFGSKGDIFDGIISLDKIAFGGEISKAESNLFLIEYFADVLKDHHSSLKYSDNLFGMYPDSRFFKYLYARDLYHTGKIKKALELFRSVNGSLSDKFRPFDYESVIYEAKCHYILGEEEKAKSVIDYAAGIHDGYILDSFRNSWIYSVKIRQEAVFRVQNLPGFTGGLSDDENKRMMEVYFDHGYFRELKRLAETLSAKDAETLVLEFRTAVITGDWDTAKKTIDILKNEHEKNFESNTDRKRLELLVNITDNYIRNKKSRR